MHRRSWLKLGIGGAVMLALGGGAAALVEPGLSGGRLAASGRKVFGNVARAFLDGSLPSDRAQQSAALQALLERVDTLVAALPLHAQNELSQLLALLAIAPGRKGLAGLGPDWPIASVPEMQAALESMRFSSLALRQQAYHAMHDITGGAFFSDASTWGLLGYPGPLRV